MIVGGGELGTLFITKLKRKEVDDVSEDFSDFSISAPARKIRRLDAELPPIMEDAEEDLLVMPRDHPRSKGLEIMELTPSGEENRERALILFNPGGSVDQLTRPGVTLSLDSELIEGLKNRHKLHLQDEDDDARRSMAANQCLAVVPWTPSRIPLASDASSTGDVQEAMDEEMGEAAMEIEDYPKSQQSVGDPNGFGFEYGGLPQWQQQHCMIPQPPLNNTTPITWFQ